MFKHALTHDVAYQTLLHSQRKELHREVAALVEELYSDRLPEFYETLAYQYREAEIPERAAHYALVSGERAAKHLAPEAEHHFRQAVDLSQGRDDCRETFIKAQAGWGDLLNLHGRIDEANGAYTEAIELASDPKTVHWLRNKIAHRHFLDRDGVRLAYYSQGEGSDRDPADTVPIVMLHPLIQGSYSFEVLAQRLCQKYCVIFMDPRGIGASDKPVEAYDFDVRVEDTLSILKKLPYRRFILNGDSDGVRVALRIYHAMPDRIEKVVLFGFSVVGPFGADNPLGSRDEERQSADDFFLKPDYRQALTNFFHFLHNEPGLAAWLETAINDWEVNVEEATFKAFLSDAIDADERQLLPGIGVPTLVIAAERDGITVERVRYMAEHIPGAQFALIKGASHAAPWSAVETFLEIVTTFIDTGMLPREVWEP
jgi:pimeloyl-ACP methyl ester carboxylesterase